MRRIGWWCGLMLAVWHGVLFPGFVRAAPGNTEVVRPFEATDFALAYDVLVGAGDLHRAFLVAEQAVRAVPKDKVWRRRLALVSEWTQRPDVAAQQWLAMFEQGDRSPEVVQAVIRLAPLIEQPLVALQAWGERAKQQPLTELQWRDILALYEMAAEPVKGSVFFEAQFQAHRSPYLLEFAARLAENAGDDVRAQRLYAARVNLAPFSLDALVKAVVHLVRMGQMPEALTLMTAHEHQVPPEAFVFWRLLGQVAWEMQSFDHAQGAYAKFAGLPQATPADWSRLVFLLRDKHPAQAADMALQAYQRYGAVDQLLLALGLYVNLGDMAAQARVFDGLASQAAPQVLSDTRVLLMRAQFHQRQKKADLAWADYQQALTKEPTNSEVVLSSLWFLIDGQRAGVLPGFMQRHAEMAAVQPEFWSAYAAGNQVLERHRDAVKWYAKAAARTPDDALLLLNYGDALERSQQLGAADRVRRHAWLILKTKYPEPASVKAIGQSPELLSLARLNMLNQPGDPGMALVRQWVTEMRGLTNDLPSEQTLALVLGWAIVKEQFENARSWMWLRYAGQAALAPPLWGESQVALQLKDTQTMGRLLARHADGLPIYNRYDTAYELGHVQQALDLAFKGMSAQDDEPLYDRFRQHAPLHANYVQVAWGKEHQAGLDVTTLQFETRLNLAPQWQVVLNSSRQRHAVSEPVLASLAPDSDRLESAKLTWLGGRGPTVLEVSKRREEADWLSFSLNQSAQWGGRWSLEAGVDYRTESTVSQPMRVAGMVNQLHGSVSYALGKRESVRVAASWQRFATQWGDDLGTGLAIDLEFGYRVRTEYPDWRWRTYLGRQQFNHGVGLSAAALATLPADFQTAVANGAVDPAAYFLPESSTTLGGCLSMGENLGGQNLQRVYSKAWRPFMDVCLNHNTLSGSGVNSVFGVAGSVLGDDHWLMQLQNSDGSQTGSAASNALMLRYRRYF